MPGRGRRLITRRAREPQRRTYGKWLGQGPLARDGKTNFIFPVKDMVRQCGVLVSARFQDGSYDRVEPADPKCPSGPAPTWVQAPDYVARPGALICYRFDQAPSFLTDSGSKHYHSSTVGVGEET